MEGAERAGVFSPLQTTTYLSRVRVVLSERERVERGDRYSYSFQYDCFEREIYVGINIKLPYRLITNHKKHIDNGTISSPSARRGRGALS
jgi:hypothetical protein